MSLLNVFDRSQSKELLKAYRQTALLVLDAATRGESAGDESDLSSLRCSVKEVKAKLVAENVQVADVLVAAGTASASIQEYNRKASEARRGRAAEFLAVVEMLTETVGAVASSSEQSLRRIRGIEKRLAKSQETYDIRELRQQMSDCLADVREEAACRKRESERTVVALRTALSRAGSPDPDEAMVDHEPDASGIGEAIEQAAKQCPSLFVAVLVIDHLQAIVSRFGVDAGAQVAAYCAVQARANLKGMLLAMPWRGSACVALLDGGAAGADLLERSVAHEANQRRTFTLQMGGREAMLQVSYSRECVLPVSGRPVGNVIESMKAFLAQAPPSSKT